MGVATATAIVGLGVAGYQAYQGAQDKKAAKKAINNYKTQELTNKAEDLTVSTRGADIAKEGQARLQAGQIDALRGSGLRGLGFLGRVEEGSQRVYDNISANIDEQQKAIDRAVMDENVNIRQMKESRQQQDLAALSSQYNSGNQQMWSGIGGMTQSAMSGLGAMKNPEATTLDTKPQAKALSQATGASQSPMGIQPMSTGLTPGVQLGATPSYQSYTQQPGANTLINQGQNTFFGNEPTYNNGKIN